MFQGVRFITLGMATATTLLLCYSPQLKLDYDPTKAPELASSFTEAQISFDTMATNSNERPMDGPDLIIPANEAPPKQTFREQISHNAKAFTTKEGLIGDYDYGKYSCFQKCGSLADVCSVLVHTQPSIHEQFEEESSFLRASGKHASCF
jgi:hypothetical protein